MRVPKACGNGRVEPRIAEVAPRAQAAAQNQKRGREGFSTRVLPAPVALPASRPWIWPLVAVLAACAPFFHGLSLTKIFYVRDLATFFWPRHLWIRGGL